MDIGNTVPDSRSPSTNSRFWVIAGRPQDLYNMRFCDIDTSGEIWKYTPFTHKTKKKGKVRELPIGPKAQEILRKYFDQRADAYIQGKAWVFDNPEQFIFLRPSGKPYTGGCYGDRVARACKKAGVPHWSPNQLRHSGGTEVREKFGLDAAQAILGHSHAQTTQIYAKVSFEKAAKVAREIG